ncbi:MAG: type II toxin-antitoxin system Phd/YefM family antitoxin [Propionibacteriaceae bacterium]|jgi:antitoxin Phd|nr:type II toxin-antitoxin system Phd/YefM family antitoxin [Propionibacteriaceae bacterium]
MLVDTQNLVSLTEANQNFSRVARLVDERGSVVILRNNVPRYVVLDYRQVEAEQTTDDEVATAGRHWIAKHLAAFEELAQ